MQINISMKKYKLNYIHLFILCVFLWSAASWAQGELTATDIRITLSSVTDTVVVENNQQHNATIIGADFQYRLALTNLTNFDADTIRVTQILPPDVTFLSSTRPPASHQANLLSWTLEGLAAMDSIVWDIEVHVNENTSDDIDELVCFANFNCANDSVGLNNSFTEIVKLIRPAWQSVDIGVEISAQTDSSFEQARVVYPASLPDEHFQYMIRVYNNGPIAAENVQVVHTLPSHIISTGQDPVYDSASDSTMSWFFPNFAIEQDTTIIVNAMAAYNGERPSIATVSVSAQDEILLDNNADSVAIWILRKPPTTCDLEVEFRALTDSILLVDGDSFPAGKYDESFDLITSVKNNGPATAHNVRVQNTWPDELYPVYFSRAPLDSTMNTYVWQIDSVLAGETWSVGARALARDSLATLPLPVSATATITADNDTVSENNTQNVTVYLLGDPVVGANLSIRQSIKADSVEMDGSDSLPVVFQDEAYEATLLLSNWSPTEGQNVVLTYLVDDSLEIISASPSPDIYTPDSVAWRFDVFESNRTYKLTVDFKVPAVMPVARTLMQNRAVVSADNEDVATLSNNESLLSLVNYGVPVEPFEPLLDVTPTNPSVSDSIRIRVSFPVHVTSWDLWIHLPNGDIITDFADAFIQNTIIEPGVWYDIDVPYFHSTLLSGGSTDEISVELHATGRLGNTGSAREQVLVSLGFDLVPPNVVSPGSTEIPIDFVVSSGRVEMKLYDVAGRLITNLVDEEYAAGRHTLMWNGMTESGQLVGSGVYLVTLHTEQADTWKKMIIVR